MDVRAIILLGAQSEGVRGQGVNSGQHEPEHLMGFPIGALELLGQPVVCHVIDRLRSHGISEINLLGPVESQLPIGLKGKIPANVKLLGVARSDIWALAEDLFLRMSAERADTVIVLRVGPYVELDFNQFLNFHLSRRNCASTVFDQVGNPLDVLALDSSRKTEAAPVLRRKLRWNWRPAEMFHCTGYINALQDGRDFRMLAEDALMRRCALIPRGKELKPGVWIGKNARIHSTAEVEGAAFVGDRAKIGARVHLSEYSTIESHSHVDQGTRLNGSTVLPFSYVGRALNVNDSVVGCSQITQVNQNITVSIADEKLIRSIPASQVKRTLEPMRAALSKVTKSISDRFAQPEAGHVSAQAAHLVLQPVRPEIAEKTTQPKTHAAAASASTGVRVKKRAAHS